jgi:hypothetical protein
MKFRDRTFPYGVPAYTGQLKKRFKVKLEEYGKLR